MHETKNDSKDWKEKIECLRIQNKRKELELFDTPKTSWGQKKTKGYSQ